MTLARVVGPALLRPVPPSLAHLLVAAARAAPDVEALVCEDVRLTYREYLAQVASLALALDEAGMRGHRVALILGNSIEMAVASFALHMAGAQAVLLNPLYTERELAEILADAAPRLVMHEPGKDPLMRRLGQEQGFATRSVERGAFATTSAAPDVLPPWPEPDHLATLQYTGGTTGRPKGVDLSHRAITTNVAQREAMLPTRPGAERILCTTPLFHSYATAMALHLAAYAQSTLVIVPRYHPEAVLHLLQAERITIFPGSPTLFVGLMNHPRFEHTDFSALGVCYSGSSALLETTLRRWEDAVGCRVYEGYGQTEAGPVLTYNAPGGSGQPGSVGVPLPLTEVEIVDIETGTRILERGERGEVRGRGPQVMRGYRNKPEETANALRGGWLYTGDIGEIDDAGILFIRDRKKEMVIVGGFNVYPREVEEVLISHPDLIDVAVIGVPDAYRGEVIKAFVVAKTGTAPDANGLVGYCQARLAPYKVPKSIEVCESLPKSSVGKTDKLSLKVASQTVNADG